MPPKAAFIQGLLGTPQNTGGVTTPAISNSAQTTINGRSLLSQVQRTYPFTPEAQKQLSSAPISAYRANSTESSENEVQSYYSPPGVGIQNALGKYLPSSVTDTIASKLSPLNPASLSFKPGSANVDAANHEALNYLFNNSPMGGTTGGNQNNNQARQAFINTWNKVASKGVDDPDGSTLYSIDKQIGDTGEGNKNDSYITASERFAYLGQQVAKDGIQVIPPELRPYYAGIISGINPATSTPKQSFVRTQLPK